MIAIQSLKTFSNLRWLIICFTIILVLIGFGNILPSSSYAQVTTSDSMNQTGTLWAPYLEWSLENSTYSGNPFDLVATATFKHTDSGESRTTEMFYAGGESWKFRFTGTRTGDWTFTTASSDPDLNGKSGAVTINPNPDPRVKGFITSVGNKVARQTGPDGQQLEAYIYNVYQDDGTYLGDFWNWSEDKSLDYIRTYPAEKWATEYLAKARANGSNTLFIALANQWFKVGALSYDEHNSVDPDLLTFDMLERVIATAHQQGGHIQLWMWGDETRGWTQTGVGGINGTPDKRLQRYIAARLGPLPGWTMGYGFDLEEWVTEGQIGEWAGYMHQKMGWQHLLWARNLSNGELDAVSYNGQGPNSYQEVLDKMQSDFSRPHLEEERFYYQRWNKYDMTTTRRQFWWNTMAGGMGSHWGDGEDNEKYPNPEQLQTHWLFWANRFLLDMDVANNLTDGYALKDSGNAHYIFYKDDSDTIDLDLSAMAGSQPAVAIDTKKAYQELDLGSLSATDQTWNAPYSSDWAIAIGSFEDTQMPEVVKIEFSLDTPTKLIMTFNEPIDENSATNINNYAINNDITILSASLGPDYIVTLTTTPHSSDTTYAITLNNILDRAPTANSILPDTRIFYTPTETFIPLIFQSWVNQLLNYLTSVSSIF